MNRVQYIAVFIFLWLILFAGGIKDKNNPLKETPKEDFQERVDQFIQEGLDFELGETQIEIINKLGKPKSIKIEKVKNFHYPDEIIDEIYELFYDGLIVKIYKATEGDKEMLQSISLTSNKYKVKWGLNIGSSKDEVKKNLGNPLKEEDDIYTYKNILLGYPGHDRVYFFFRDGIIYKIDWEFWID